MDPTIHEINEEHTRSIGVISRVVIIVLVRDDGHRVYLSAGGGASAHVLTPPSIAELN